MTLHQPLMKIKKWQRAEFTYRQQEDPRHFIHSRLAARFSCGDRQYRVSGFYNDGGEFKLRFMPDREGRWTFITESNLPELDGLTGELECVAPASDATGPVRVADGRHFRHANGEPYYPFGTTAYVWNYQAPEIQQQTLDTLAAGPFNKLRMCVFPKHYTYNFAEPRRFPFPGNIREGFDFTRFDCAFFAELEQQIDSLQALGIEVDLILFHPYDRWGFANLERSVDHRYIRYVVARLASFSNVWWSLANEFDLLKTKPMAFWDGIFELIGHEDPWHHLLSIHNWHNPPLHYTSNAHWYDHRNSLVTHASIQHHDLNFIPGWLEHFDKPVVIDECRYEGNVDLGWGNISAQKMVELFWTGVCKGGYVTHGESYLSDDDIIWWSHGGRLKGDSAPRIAFLRGIIEQGRPKRLTPFVRTQDSHWDAAIGFMDDDYWLIYFGDSQPQFKLMTMLPDGVDYRVDIIDTWAMTITPLGRTLRAGERLTLPGRPGIALRLQKAVGE